MTSINKTSENNIENALMDNDQSCDPEQLTEENKIILKYSEAKPYVGLLDAESDSNQMITESNGKPPLYFDDVSPTSSNNQLSDDESGPHAEKKSENIFQSIFSTVIEKNKKNLWLFRSNGR